MRNSQRVLAASWSSVRLARKRIERSREHLSRSEEVVVRSASRVGAARTAMRRR